MTHIVFKSFRLINSIPGFEIVKEPSRGLIQAAA